MFRSTLLFHDSFYNNEDLKTLQNGRKNLLDSSPQTVEIFNPFYATGFFLYPLKTSQNLQFFYVLRVIERGQ